MRLIKIRESWVSYLPKLLALSLLMIGLAFWLFQNYRIGIDSQTDRCIPEYRVYLIDLNDSKLIKGNIYAFKSKGVEPIFRDGTTMVKFLSAKENDFVEVSEKFNVLVNNEVVASGLPLLNKISNDAKDFNFANKFIGKKILGKGEMWFLGKSFTSFDSRYWGVVKNEQIIGRAHPLF